MKAKEAREVLQSIRNQRKVGGQDEAALPEVTTTAPAASPPTPASPPATSAASAAVHPAPESSATPLAAGDAALASTPQVLAARAAKAAPVPASAETQTRSSPAATATTASAAAEQVEPGPVSAAPVTARPVLPQPLPYRGRARWSLAAAKAAPAVPPAEDPGSGNGKRSAPSPVVSLGPCWARTFQELSRRHDEVHRSVITLTRASGTVLVLQVLPQNTSLLLLA